MARRLTRRQVLQSSIAAALTAPYFVPSSAFGANDKIQLAHIGIGGQGGYHLDFNTKKKDESPVRVVAICDVDRHNWATARWVFGQRYGSDAGITYTEDFRELAGRKDIDAVLIAVPDHWHALITLAMLRGGKDVYCEKPLTRTIQEGRAVANAARRYARVLQTGSQERSNPNARYVADVIANGYLGKIKKVDLVMPVTNHGPIPRQTQSKPPAGFNYDMWLGPAPEKYYFFSQTKDPIYKMNYQRCYFWFRYQLDYATGEMSDRGAHMLDLVQLALGRSLWGPVEVSGTGTRDTAGEFDTFTKYDFRLRYEDGVEVHGTSEGNDDTRGITYHGEKGWINCHVHGCKLTASDPKLLTIKLKSGEETVGGQGPEAIEHHQSFYNAVRNRGTPSAPAEVGHRSATVCHLVTIATLLGRRLTWDPKAEKFIGDEQANQQLGRAYRAPWTL